MRWADAAPNLLIGLREGLEAGLVVSMLLAALRKTTPEGGHRASSAPVWLGVLGATMVSVSFAAVLTYSTSVLSSRAQQAVAGVFSVLAVGLVTGMVFWMRRTAATMSAQLRGEVVRATSIGAGALAITAFLTVGREGLETTLFLWTAIRASGTTVAPVIGAAVGLLTAVVLCWLLYRRAIRLNLGVFFRRTAVALIVIAAGVLAYGLGDLQDAGWLPGQRWVGFDLSNHVATTSWWVSIVSGVTELEPRMTVLQVVAWCTYLAVVLPLFLLARRTAPAAAPAAPVPTEPASAGRWDHLTRHRAWALAGAFVAIPVVAAGLTIAVLPSASAASTTAVTVDDASCAPGWTSGHTGTQTFTVANRSSEAGQINLDNSSGAVVAELETIGPATSATMTATLGAGSYQFRCYLSGRPVSSSGVVQLDGSRRTTTPAVTPVTVAELTPANTAYKGYAARDLETLSQDVATLHADLSRGDLAAARHDWLTAQLAWERVGASYDSFGALGVAVDGLPDGLPDGVHDSHFTGLHRVEYGLWHHAGTTTLLPVVDQLAANVRTIRRHLGSDDLAGDPTNLPIRAHEILEDALRDHLSGIDDLGAGAAYAETYADTQVTRAVLRELAPLITARAPELSTTLDRQLGVLQRAVLATRAGGRWRSLPRTPLDRRQRVDAAIGTALQSLSRVPDLLEVRPAP